MEININKSKTMIIANEIKEQKIQIKGQLLEQVKSYKYLGTLIGYNGKVNGEIAQKTVKVGRLFNMLKSTCFGRKEILKKIKTQVYQRVVKPSLIYGSESWTQSKVKTMVIWFLRKKGIITRDRIRNTLAVEELINIVPIEKVIEDRQLSLVGHVHRMNEERLAGEIFEVRVPGKNEVGKPQKRWIEQVRQRAEWRDI